MKEYTSRPISWCIAPKGETATAKMATIISLCDEGAGEYVTIEQEDGKASFDPDEWPAIRDVIENAFKIALE
jgi:hypothetical protein